MSKQKLFLIIVLIAFFSLTPFLSITQTTKAQNDNPLKIEKIIGLSPIPGTFRDPTAIAVAKDGTIFIADASESQIEVFDSELKYLRNFGSIGIADHQFQRIIQIRFDLDEKLYILDSVLCQIKIFTKDGTFLKKWGTKGKKESELKDPIDFHFLNQEEMIVLERGAFLGGNKNSVKVFSREGVFKRFLVTDEKYNNDDIAYTNIEIDNKGTVYLNSYNYDTYASLLYAFSQKGEYIGSYKVVEFASFYSIKNMVLLEPYFYFIVDSALLKFQMPSENNQTLLYIDTIINEKEDDSGIIYLFQPFPLFCTTEKIYIAYNDSNLLMIYNHRKKLIGSIQSPVKETYDETEGNENVIPKGIMSGPQGLAIGPDDQVYVSNLSYRAVKVFDSNGTEVNSYGNPYTNKKKSNQRSFPRDIIVDKFGYSYVCIWGTNLIGIFDSGMKPILSLNIIDGEPLCITINHAGFLLICISAYPNDLLYYYDISNIQNKRITRKKTIPIPDPSGGDPEDMVIDQYDNIILSFSYGTEIMVIDTDGQMINSFDVDDNVGGILCDGEDNLYVTLPDINSIHKMDINGEIIWRSTLDWYPLQNITMDSKGMLYVTDAMHSLLLAISDTTAVPPKPITPPPIETEAKFSLQLSNEKILETETFSVFLIGEDLEKCSSYEFSIQFPSNLLGFKSAAIGALFEDTTFRLLNQTETSGLLTVQIKSRKGDVMVDSGRMLEIQFEALKAGAGRIDFNNIVQQNPLGQTAKYQEKSGLTFTIQSVDKTPPMLEMTPIPEVVYEPILLILGKTEREAIVTINKKPVEVTADGKFEIKLTLQMGKNKIFIIAEDKAGNKTELTLEITLKKKTIIILHIGSKEIIVNETPGVLDSEPYIDKNSGRTMVPLRAIGEAIGAIISFDPSTQRIDIKKDATIIQLWIGKPKAMVNGVSVDIDSEKPVSPVIVKGRTFLPLRFIAEAFEFKVEWDAPTQRITLTYPKE